MSDNILERDVQVGLEMGWHGKTKVVKTVTKELVYPWTVALVPLNRGDTGQQLDKWVIPIASDDNLPLGFGNPINLRTYTPENPHETWEFMEIVLKDTEYRVVSAGTVQNRSKFFVSAELVQLEKITVLDGSEIKLYFNGMGSLDKSLNKKLCVSSTRTVCYNTLMLDFLAEQTVESLRKTLGEKFMPWVTDEIAKKTKMAWKYRHSKNMQTAVRQDFDAMEQAAGYSAIVKAMFNQRVQTPCNVDRAERIYVGYLFGQKDEKLSTRARGIIDEHLAVFQGEAKDSGNSGRTEFDLLNGFTQPLTRGYSSSERDSWDIFETSDFGVYANRKNDFAGMLSFDRDHLGKVENRGKELLAP